jgi:hypothetical protein
MALVGWGVEFITVIFAINAKDVCTYVLQLVKIAYTDR